MAGGKKTYKKTYKKKTNTKMANMVKSIVSKQLVKTAEKKFLDYGFTFNSGSYAAYCLSAIPAGQTDVTRIGDQCKLQNLQIKMILQNADSYNMIRVFIVRANFNVNPSVLPAATAVLQDISTAQNRILSPFTFDTLRQGNYTILMDKVIAVDSDDPAKFNKKFLKLRGSAIDFVGGSNEGKGHIIMYIASDSVLAADPTVYVYSRVTFTDI